ncbi:putative transcriptional regulator [Desulfocurvibacter africanus PCS]|uniref:Putative transcriptional regulator n=1 Tax=Desulfocurvibacter africanus PCS TaxID=1262666 RepID=M5Q179_DESAF|nr:XRE family transcriptional regulator [Desulfocurvibacter africanus]EMG37336.1 putative transcriptional regulator [Desulfocurvibacter africanus PCS]
MGSNEGSSFASDFEVKTRNLEGFTDRLKKLRIKRGMTQQDVANKLGVSLSTMQNFEKGQYPKGEQIIGLAEVLETTTDWLLRGVRGARPQPDGAKLLDQVGQPCGLGLVLVPKVKARISAGTGSLETNSEIKGRFAFRSDWIRSKGNPEAMVLMDVTGDSMSPVIEETDTTLIDLSQTDIYVGKIYAIGIDSEVFVKYVDRVPGKFILRSANKNYEPIAVNLSGESSNVRIIGRVVWWCREAR